MCNLRKHISDLESTLISDEDETTPRKVARIRTSCIVNNQPPATLVSGTCSSKNSNNSNNNDDENFTTVVSKKKQKKIIKAVNTNINVIKNIIKYNTDCSNYIIKQNSNKAPVKISITEDTEIPVIKSALQNNNIGFHEYKFDSEKKKGFLIRGLIGVQDEDIPLIKNQLILAGLPEAISVSRFETGYMKANSNSEKSSLIKLILPPNCDINILKGVKYIDHVSVSVEPMKIGKIIQCKNCQRFGHSSSGCMHQHRCVKCGENHYKIDCKRTTDKSFKLKCCNCDGEHTANNLTECAYYQKYYNRIDKEPFAVSTAGNKMNKNNSSGAKNIFKNFSNNTNIGNSNNSSIFSSLQTKNSRRPLATSTSSESVNGIRTQNRVIYQQHNNNQHNISYANVVKSNTQRYSHTVPDSNTFNNDLMFKLDMIYNLVMKHEKILSNSMRYE